MRQVRDENRAELDGRLDAVVRLSNSRLRNAAVDWKREAYQTLAQNFQAFRQSLQQGTLSEGFATGKGFGASRVLSEWDLGDDEMLAAVEAAEAYYRTGT